MPTHLRYTRVYSCVRNRQNVHGAEEYPKTLNKNEAQNKKITRKACSKGYAPRLLPVRVFLLLIPVQLRLLVEARPHVKDIALRVADCVHLLDHLVGLDVSAILNRYVRPALVSGALGEPRWRRA